MYGSSSVNVKRLNINNESGASRNNNSPLDKLKSYFTSNKDDSIRKLKDTEKNLDISMCEFLFENKDLDDDDLIFILKNQIKHDLSSKCNDYIQELLNKMDFREFYLDENPIKIDERSPCLNKTEFVGLPHLNQLRQIFNMRKISSDSNNSLSEFLVNQRRYFFKILKEKDSTDSIKSDDIQILKELDEFINLFTLTKKIEEFIKTDPLNKLRRYNTSSNVDSDFERFIVNEELQIVMHNFLSSIPETHVALDELRIKMNSDVTLAKPEILDILDEKKKFSCAQLQDLVDYVNTFDNEVKNYSDRDNYITKRYYFKKILNSVFTKQRKVYIDSILSPSNQNAMLNGLVSKNNILKNSKNYILLCGKRTTQIEREKDEIKAIKKTFKSEDMINYFNELLATKNKEIASINSNILSQCQTELNKFEIKVRKKINDIHIVKQNLNINTNLTEKITDFI